MHDVIIMLKNKSIEKNEEKATIYRRNKMADYFVLILEGEVRVTVGKENLQFTSGPFSYYGASVLQSTANSLQGSPLVNRAFKHDDESTSFSNNPTAAVVNNQAFLPDYTLQALGDCKYIKITKKQFSNALRTTQMSGLDIESAVTTIRNSPLPAKKETNKK